MFKNNFNYLDCWQKYWNKLDDKNVKCKKCRDSGLNLIFNNEGEITELYFTCKDCYKHMDDNLADKIENEYEKGK